MSRGFLLVLLLIIAVYLLSSIRRLPDHERALLIRLGYVTDQVKGPGTVMAFAPVDQLMRIDLRRYPLDLPEFPASTSNATREHILALLKAERTKFLSIG